MINIVLHNPEIPQNTGNIARTCVGLKAKLHLIEPLGFDISEKSVRRAGCDYWEHLDIETYKSWEDFVAKNEGTYYFLTRYGKKSYDSFDYSDVNENIFLVFGAESKGIPYEILKNNLDTCLRIPMSENMRSLNLSNCAMLLGYEVARQRNFANLSTTEVHKGADFLEEL